MMSEFTRVGSSAGEAGRGSGSGIVGEGESGGFETGGDDGLNESSHSSVGGE
jgi:hypothetical protein